MRPTFERDRARQALADALAGIEAALVPLAPVLRPLVEQAHAAAAVCPFTDLDAVQRTPGRCPTLLMLAGDLLDVADALQGARPPHPDA